jgi:outer membrane protein assembly factor BamB
MTLRARLVLCCLLVGGGLSGCHPHSSGSRPDAPVVPTVPSSPTVPTMPSATTVPSSPKPGQSSSEVIGTLPPTTGPPIITVLPGAADVALARTAATGQFFASGGPVSVGGLRLATTGKSLVATNLKTGHQVWSFDDADEPDLLEFAVGGGVVAIGVGHDVGGAMIYPATEHLDVVDLATGTELWRSTVPGDVQSPSLVAMPGLVVFESTGHVIAVHARTGVLAWSTVPAPGCITGNRPAGSVGLAADADVLAATFGCASTDTVAERLDLGTGTAVWTTPRYPGGMTQLLAVPVNTDVVVIPEMGNGSYLEGPIRQWTPPGVDENNVAGAVYTVLDAATGAPRWTETLAPIYGAGAFGDNAGSVCFIGAHTFECRAPKDGSLVRVGGGAT